MRAPYFLRITAEYVVSWFVSFFLRPQGFFRNRLRAGNQVRLLTYFHDGTGFSHETWHKFGLYACSPHWIAAFRLHGFRVEALVVDGAGCDGAWVSPSALEFLDGGLPIRLLYDRMAARYSNLRQRLLE